MKDIKHPRSAALLPSHNKVSKLDKEVMQKTNFLYPVDFRKRPKNTQKVNK